MEFFHACFFVEKLQSGCFLLNNQLAKLSFFEHPAESACQSGSCFHYAIRLFQRTHCNQMLLFSTYQNFLVLHY